MRKLIHFSRAVTIPRCNLPFLIRNADIQIEVWLGHLSDAVFYDEAVRQTYSDSKERIPRAWALWCFITNETERVFWIYEMKKKKKRNLLALGFGLLLNIRSLVVDSKLEVTIVGALSYLTKCNQRRRAICFIDAATAAVVRSGVFNLNVSLKMNVRKCKPGFSLLQPPLYSAVRPMLDRKKMSTHFASKLRSKPCLKRSKVCHGVGLKEKDIFF